MDRRQPFFLGLLDGGEAERDMHGDLRQELEAIRDLQPARFDAADRPHALREEMARLDATHRHSADVLHKAFGEFHHAFIDTRDNVNEVNARERLSSGILHKAFADLHEAVMDMRSNREATLAGSPPALYLDRLSVGNKRVLIYQLLTGLPVPRFVWRALRGTARAARAVLRPLRGR